MLIVDSREPTSIYKKLSKSIESERDFIEVGDYLLPDGYVIERKKGRDLFISLTSKRLFSQLNNINQAEHPILAIITDNIWREFYFTKSNYIHKSYIGLLSTITSKYPKIRIIFLESDEQLIDFIISLHKKLTEDGHKERPVSLLRKTTNLNEIKENSLAQIPGVGIAMAKNLLKHFNSINRIANSTEAELMSIKNLGKKTAKRILEVLN